LSRYAPLFTDAAPEPEGAAPAEPGYRILLVDDEANVLKALGRVFREENYRVLAAASGTEALEILAREPVQLIISDYRMPGMNGAEFLRRVKDAFPDTIRIMLTGHAHTNAVMGAVNEGAVYKFILKPWDDDDLRVTVALALEQHDLIQRNRLLKRENVKKSKEIGALSRLAVTHRSQLALLLHRRGRLTDQQTQQLYKLQQARKAPMIRLVLERGWVAEKDIRDALRREHPMDEVSLPEFQVEPALLDLLPVSFCERQLVLPLKLEGRRLLLAVADPSDIGLVDDLRFVTGLDIQPVLAGVQELEDKIQALKGDGEASFKDLETLVSGADPYESIEDDDEAPLEELLRGTEEPPAIRIVNAIIIEAVRSGVSDIHVQPRTKSVVVRYRIDGVLKDKIHIPLNLHSALVSRIKVMAEMDISERRRPQDGRITVKTPMRIVDMRISTLPTINGEKVVMRILDRNAAIFKIDEIGFPEAALNRVRSLSTKPQGIILATGPTGSGKTSTLYALLQHQATPEKNYVTIEDPVEYYMDLAGQVLIREKIGLDFATVLRAILRQDPDVILLGEIRDLETAEVAFHAALTGHLVFSTLHTNSAVATIARLLDLGLKPFVLASALEGIVAQRLVRRVCAQCRTAAEPDPAVTALLGPLFDPARTPCFKGAGCRACDHSGYHGRAPVFELLTPDDRLRDLISRGAPVLDIDAAARATGTGTLLEDARDKVAAGITTPQEVLRVLGAQVTVRPEAAPGAAPGAAPDPGSGP
jgi:type II secretory ATPase GspE/PulE/Tfp pilus assembly ATPase PilB-like protein/DNA-binding response OmpR family regulator